MNQLDCVPAVVASPLVGLWLLGAKIMSKDAGPVPSVRSFDYRGREGMYYTLMMSAGLTFGTTSALVGLQHGVVTQGRHLLVQAAVPPVAVPLPESQLATSDS